MSLRDVLDDDGGDLAALDLDALRERRTDLKAIEDGTSYLRRLVQGRLDVLAAEAARRAEGDDGDAMDALLERLPELLATSTRAAGPARPPQRLDIGDLDPALAAEYEALVASVALDRLADLDDAALTAATEALVGFERSVSGVRRRLFDHLDACETELARRYRTGEASVDRLLD